MNRFYYPLSYLRLADIFGSGCIVPACLNKAGIEDVQTMMKESILITTNFGCNRCDCCLEIVFNNDEIKDYLIDIKNGFYIYEKAIPVSRIKKIFFKNHLQCQKTVAMINMATAFVPQQIVDKGSYKFESIDFSIEQIPQDFIADIDTLRKQVRLYDRIMGALALQNVARKPDFNCSKHYIDSLSFFNTRIKREKNSVRGCDESNWNVFDKQVPKGKLEMPLSLELVEQIAKESNQNIVKNRITKEIDLSQLKDKAFTYAVLYSYGVSEESRKHKIDDLIIDNFQTPILRGEGEKIALYYGYNRGYSVFNNEFRIQGKTVEVKFKLDSLLDYYIIESVYNYVFNNVHSDEFAYLEDWVVRKDTSIIADRGDYVIIDTIIHDKKKPSVLSDEWWKELLGGFIKESDFFIKAFNTSLYTPFLLLLRPIGEKIVNDLTSEFTQRHDVELNLLKNEINTLREKVKEAEEQHDCTSQNGVGNTFGKESDKDIIEECARLACVKKITEIEKEAKEKGIIIPNSKKGDEKKKELIKAILSHRNDSLV